MNASWKYIADESVFEFVASPALGRSPRRRLQDAFRRIADRPDQRADLLGYDSAGRPFSIVKEGEFEIVYWVDHAPREVRIISIFGISGYSARNAVSGSAFDARRAGSSVAATHASVITSAAAA